jgi:hypothetical protein
MAEDPVSERRRNVRIDLLAELQGHLVTLDERVMVTQVSLGGMTVETSAPLSPRIEHDFRISFDGVSVLLHGKVVHSRVSVRGDEVSYVAGVQFLNPSPDAVAALRAFLDPHRSGSSHFGDPER